MVEIKMDSRSDEIRKPRISNIVIYQSYGTPGGEYKSKPRAAIVTDVGEDGSTCSLTVFNPEGMFLNKAIPYSEEPKPGHWHWPQKE